MRQREGIELAKKEGKFKGRLKKYHKNHAGIAVKGPNCVIREEYFCLKEGNIHF
jgi:DNA invertase Pin-like site-specific DNA recombinase